MGWEELTASIVQSVAWPFSAVLLGVIFRGELKALLGRITSMKLPGGTAATFATELDRGEVFVHRVRRNLPESVQRRQFELEVAARSKGAETADEADSADEDRLDDGPAAQVIVAWTRLSEAVVELLRAQPNARPTPHVRLAVKQLIESGVVSTDFAQAINALQDLRNSVAHGAMPNKASARIYAKSAQELGATVRALMPETPTR
jgi:hypothetical protein